MTDPWNASPDEIRAWAYAPGAIEPCQDWDLVLCWSLHEKALLETVADEDCPNRRFLLGVLYLVVGDAVRCDFRSRPRPIIEGFLARSREYHHPDIQLWRERSEELLGNPSSFDYGLWCGGGYVREMH